MMQKEREPRASSTNHNIRTFSSSFFGARLEKEFHSRFLEEGAKSALECKIAVALQGTE
jgi:hypothetical protein